MIVGTGSRDSLAAGTPTLLSSRSSFPNRHQNIRHHFALRLCTDVAFAVETDTDGVGGHVARADHQHRVHLRLLGLLDFAVDFVGAVIALGADHARAEFLDDGLGVIDQRLLVADREDADLFGREPEREVAGVMLDQETDETLVCTERRAMDAQRRLVRVVFVSRSFHWEPRSEDLQ